MTSGRFIPILIIKCASLILVANFAAIAICRDRFDRSLYLPVLDSIRKEMSLDRAVAALEGAGCVLVFRSSRILKFECLPRAEESCRYAPAMVDAIILRFDDGTIIETELSDTLSYLPKTAIE